MFVPQFLATLSRRWRAGRTTRALAALDARALCDIGLDRSQILSVSTTLAERSNR